MPLPGLPQPTKFTARTREKILAAIRVGATRSLAAKYARISDRSLYNWLKKGQEDRDNGIESEYSLFLEEYEQAEAEAALRDLAAIEQAVAANDWKAAAWRLSRRYPGDYGKRVMTDVTHTSKEIKIARVRVEPLPGQSQGDLIEGNARLLTDGDDDDELSLDPPGAVNVVDDRNVDWREEWVDDVSFGHP